MSRNPECEGYGVTAFDLPDFVGEYAFETENGRTYCMGCISSGNITDPEDEFWTGCDEDCPDDCTADHRGEE